MDDDNPRMVFVINGHLVSMTDRTMVGSTGVDGRVEVRGSLPLNVDFRLLVDEGPLAAVHGRTTYGFKHLRALLDTLPRCTVGVSPGEKCGRCATFSLTGVPPDFGDYRACDVHRDDSTSRWAEYDYAPAVRHIEMYVRDFERDNKVPEGER
jgi:hypothetical protein